MMALCVLTPGGCLPSRDWIDLLEALGPLIAVGAVIMVGFLQVALQLEQVKQDLFDKRYKVYEAVDAFLTSVISADGALAGDAIQVFRIRTAHAEFLFGTDITDFIGEIFEKSMQAALLKAQIDRHVAAHDRFQSGESDTPAVRAGEFLIDLQASHAPLMSWVIKAQTDQNARFHSYLQLHREGRWYTRPRTRIDRWMESADMSMESRYRP
jgi:hypothetical protein